MRLQRLVHPLSLVTLLCGIPTGVYGQKATLLTSVNGSEPPPATKHSDTLPGVEQALRSHDSFHPKNFVEIFEVSRRGNGRSLFRPRDKPECKVDPRGCDRATTEVDVNSKIVINIDRNFLQKVRFAGTFGIKGTLHTAGSFRQIEIPGYSVIGKENEAVPVSVNAVSGIVTAVKDLDRWGPLLETALKADRQTVRDEYLNTMENKRKNLATLNKKKNQLETTIKSAQDGLKNLIIQRDSLATPTVPGELPDTVGITENSKQQISARNKIDALNVELRKVLVDLKTEDNQLDKESDEAYVLRARNTLRSYSQVHVALKVFTNPHNESIVQMLAEHTGKLPEVILKLARSSDSLWTIIVTEDSDVATPKTWAQTASAVDGLVDLMAALREKKDSSSLESLNTKVLSALKDAEFNLQRIGAKAGDRIVLTLTDSIAGQQGSTRVLELQLLVREFGFIRNITDAVLIMNMQAGIRRRHEQAEIDAAQALADASDVARTYSYPMAVHGSPAAGVTLSWTYAPRLYDERSSIPDLIRAIAHWLQPGFGVNAAVPSVTQKTVTVTPRGTTGTATPPNITTESSELTYTAGVIATFFDNAVSWSWGRNLNGERSRRYTAVGISFLAATEKAKELFKKYGD